MAIHVYDTFAHTATGKIMHFDVLISTRDDQKAFDYARQWLAEIGEQNAKVKSGNCAFCHTTADLPQFSDEIKRKGYAIYKLEGCPA